MGNFYTFNMDLFDLKGKRILITGASSGIGMATSLYAGKCGAQLILTGRNEEKLKQTLSRIEGNGHKLLIADLNDKKQIEHIPAEIPAIDGLVHCAGATAYMPAKFIKHKDIQKLFSVNYDAVVLLTASLLAAKKINNAASIVFVSSAASRHPYFGGALYASSKSAVETYARVLALEMAPKKIRVNCISPTFVKTDMLEEAEKIISKEVLDNFEKTHPMGFGDTTDVANAIVFFLSDASRWISGANLALGGI